MAFAKPCKEMVINNTSMGFEIPPKTFVKWVLDHSYVGHIFTNLVFLPPLERQSWLGQLRHVILHSSHNYIELALQGRVTHHWFPGKALSEPMLVSFWFGPLGEQNSMKFESKLKSFHKQKLEISATKLAAIFFSDSLAKNDRYHVTWVFSRGDVEWVRMSRHNIL